MKEDWKKLLSAMLMIVSVVLLLVGLRKFVFTPVTVEGASMNPTLEDGERVFGILNSKIQRFDIVSFPAPNNNEGNFIKRVIGLPGDTVEYSFDILYINGERVAEPYLAKYQQLLADNGPLMDDFNLESLQQDLELQGIELALTADGKIPEGKIFVLGDNRRVSKDSRMIGFISENEMIAKIKFSIWPLNKIGFVK